MAAGAVIGLAATISLTRTISLDPIGNRFVGFCRRLPEKAMGLALEQLEFGAGDAVSQ